MKVALCISGMMRNFDGVFPSTEKHLLSIYNPDVFIHTWDKDEANQLVNRKKIIELYKPKSIVLEPPKQFTPSEIMKKNNVDRRPLNAMCSMFYKIKECNKLKSKWEISNNFVYDCVVRFRPDIRLRADFVVGPLEPNTITFPRYGDYGGLNDQFAWSDSHSIDIYSNLFDYLDTYDIYVRPEFYMKHHMAVNNITVNKTYIPYALDKGAGIILDNELRCADEWKP